MHALSHRFLQLPCYHSCRDWLKVLLDMMQKDCGGHIGIFRIFMQEILQQYIPSNKQVTFEDVCAYYYGAMLSSTIAGRFFVLTHSLTSSTMVDALKYVLVNQVKAPPTSDAAGDVAEVAVLAATIDSVAPDHRVAGDPADMAVVATTASVAPDHRVLRSLMRFPLLVEIDGLLQFPSPMHKRFLGRMIFPSRIVELPPNINIDQWILIVLRTFQIELLRNPQSAFREPMIQHEFWRGASMCLPTTCGWASEVSFSQNGEQIDGSLDFWINSKLQWAIELMREGDRKQEHLDRFAPLGKYVPLAAKQWRVIDFRQSTSAQAQSREGFVEVRVSSTSSELMVTFPKFFNRNVTRITVRCVGTHLDTWDHAKDLDYQRLSLATPHDVSDEFAHLTIGPN